MLLCFCGSFQQTTSHNIFEGGTKKSKKLYLKGKLELSLIKNASLKVNISWVFCGVINHSFGRLHTIKMTQNRW